MLLSAIVGHTAQHVACLLACCGLGEPLRWQTVSILVKEVIPTALVWSAGGWEKLPAKELETFEPESQLARDSWRDSSRQTRAST